VRATGKAVVLLGLIARDIFGMGVILLGITTGMKEHFGKGEEASTTDTFEEVGSSLSSDMCTW
jgi:hypothetical protein